MRKPRLHACSKTAFLAVSVLVAGLCSPSRALEPADVTRGAQVFKKCVQCHAIESPRSRLGPHLMGIVGRPMGSVADYRSYSQAMKDAGTQGGIWDEEALKQFIASPKKFVPGTSMRFFGLWGEQEIVDLVEYLKTVPAPPAQ